MPPSVCILLEFCAYGSLADVIAGTGPISTAVGVSENRSLKSMFRRAYIGDKGLYITWADRLYLAIGCARGLNALHAHSPDLCHRDIKSFNFLGITHRCIQIYFLLCVF